MKAPLLHLIVWASIALATLAGYGYWYSVISDKSVVVATLQNQIDAKTARIGRIASVKAILAEVADDEATVQSYFVPETSIVPFIGSLEARVEALGPNGARVQALAAGLALFEAQVNEHLALWQYRLKRTVEPWDFVV